MRRIAKRFTAGKRVRSNERLVVRLARVACPEDRRPHDPSNSEARHEIAKQHAGWQDGPQSEKNETRRHHKKRDDVRGSRSFHKQHCHGEQVRCDQRNRHPSAKVNKKSWPTHSSIGKSNYD